MQLNRGEQTIYEYDYTRPVHIHYPQYPQNDVYYTYDSVGRLSMVRDVTGTERMEYNAMGNVSLSERIIAIPTEETAYRFRTRFTYDSFGRMRRIVYPDGEAVDYGYENGLLRIIKGNTSIPYVRDISYDLYGNVSYIQYGNGLQTNIFYDDVHLRPYNRQTYTGHDIPLQEISYTYDGVGNITRINQSVDKFSNMGGAYNVQYTYDDQYRLTRAVQNSTDLGGYDYSMGYSPSGLVATKNCSEIGANITYGYQYSSNNRISSFASHRVATLFPTNTEEVALTVWNANGELTSIVQPFQDNFRRHLWNEAGQLSLFISNEYCGYYAYDAQGNRAYKLTGMVVAYQYDAGTMQATAYFDDVTLYVNPYMVVTPRGYTKHYYNGSQRIAARLGGAWRQDSTSVQSPQLIAQGESLWEIVTNTEDLGEQEILLEDVYVGGNGSALPACQYSPNITQLSGYFRTNLLSPVFSGRASERTLTDSIGIYFYHPDHLGSANWITNSQGQAVQYIHYMPYGELWVNQQANSYDERFKFTGKERDTETGYDYFGARYYLSLLGIWLSPDPLLDKYPNISSYAFCGWNPINRIDIDGQDWYRAEDGSAVLWRSGSDASIDVNNSAYNNIGESYSFVQNGITYNYRQNEIISIGVNVMNGDNFISQFAQDYWGETPANQACQKACDAMLRSAGFTSSFSSNVIVDNINGSAGSASLKSSQVIAEMTDNLYAGYPSKVSVDIHPGNTSHADKIGDHFVIIMGVTEYLSKGNVVGANYRFFEPGTRHKNLGTSSSAVFRLTGGRLVGNAPYGQKRPYVVSSIRFCK